MEETMAWLTLKERLACSRRSLGSLGHSRRREGLGIDAKAQGSMTSSIWLPIRLQVNYLSSGKSLKAFLKKHFHLKNIVNRIIN